MSHRGQRTDMPTRTFTKISSEYVLRTYRENLNFPDDLHGFKNTKQKTKNNTHRRVALQQQQDDERQSEDVLWRLISRMDVVRVGAFFHKPAKINLKP